MSKKIKIDPHNLEFTTQSKWERITKIILADFVAIFIITIISYLIYSYTIEKKETQQIKQENKILQQEYEKLYDQYLANEKRLKILEQQDSNIYKLLFAASPDFNSQTPTIDIKSLDGRKAIKQAKNNKKEISKLLDEVKIKNQEFKEFLDTLNEKDISGIPAILPLIRSKNENYTIYGFGRKLDLIYGVSKIHQGIDIYAPYGTPVLSSMNGTVVKVVRRDKVKGNYVIIQNGDYKTVYCHLEAIKVKNGQKVIREEQIGTVGISGRAILQHLHYEVRYKDKPVNPMFYLFLSYSPQEFFEIYKEAMLKGICLD